MADETTDTIIEQPSEASKRITQLSDKVRDTAKERDEANAAKTAAEAQVAEAQRERDFYVGYADVLATNPAAKDHKDEILAKVKTGYTVEDATFAVLGKAGKIGHVPEPTQAFTGGSASTTAPQGGNSSKPVSEMTREERRSALIEAERRGDISLS